MSHSCTIQVSDLAAMDRLGHDLAAALRPGDMVTLSGGLGAGKTTLARAVITHMMPAGQPVEVPSPTFTLVQVYEPARMPVWHFDCYRLNDASEMLELGLDEALARGVALIEWPERIEELLPGDRLDIVLDDEPDGEGRLARITGHGRWSGRLGRAGVIRAFLERASWGAARRSYLQGDASARAYERLSRDGRPAILMNAPKQPDGPAIRDGKPYSAIAHLAEDVRPYVVLAKALAGAGFSVPGIYAEDLSAGLLVIEDLGDRVFAAEHAKGRYTREMTQAAVDVLIALRTKNLPRTLSTKDGGYTLPAYDDKALLIEVELVPDWFWPALRGEPCPGADQASYFAAWRPLFELLERQPAGWVLRDFHSPNLLWLPRRKGVRRVGIIDFQDALYGNPAFDLVSLLQDARVDMAPELETELLDYYCAEMARRDASFDEPQLRMAYAILGAQRNSKILGIFARLAKRDGKTAYLRHIPRVSAYLERNLAHPGLADLKAWYDRHLPAKLRIRPLDGAPE